MLLPTVNVTSNTLTTSSFYSFFLHVNIMVCACTGRCEECGSRHTTGLCFELLPHHAKKTKMGLPTDRSIDSLHATPSHVPYCRLPCMAIRCDRRSFRMHPPPKLTIVSHSLLMAKHDDRSDSIPEGHTSFRHQQVPIFFTNLMMT